MAQGNVERQEKDKQRKLEIQRQEQLLSGRIQRAKTEEHGDPSGRGPGIQIYHYKDPGEQWQNLTSDSTLPMSLGRVGDSHSRTEVQISAQCNFSMFAQGRG